MKITNRKLLNQDDTIKEIKRLSREHKSYLLDFIDFGFFKFYNHVRDLKYITDPIGEETLSRPKYTITSDWIGSRDCDDKKIIICSFCELKNIPYRIITSFQLRVVSVLVSN